MSGRKRLPSSGTDGIDAAAANKKAKKHHSEAPANIPAKVDYSSTGTSGTTVTSVASMSTPTTSCSSDKVNLTTSTLSINPIMTPTIFLTRSDQDMRLVNIPEESERLSAYINANAISSPLAKIQQNYVKHLNQIHKIRSDLFGDIERTCVGSIAEGLNVSNSDFDTIFFANNFIRKLDITPEEAKLHPGYSKLRVTNANDVLIKYIHLNFTKGKHFLKNTLKELFIWSPAKDHCPNGLIIHGPAYNTTFFEPYDKALFPNMETKETKKIDVDLVLCIKMSQWPCEASEWKTRRRASNWPTKELVDLISNSGYYLAAVGSKEPTESEIQWRVSFNEAEQLIIKSFNETQMHCIFLLKLFNSICLSHIAGKNITSYTMKTVMFWCLEEKSESTYWKSSNLVRCFSFCVSKLKSFVGNGFLPNYFIRKRNQFVESEFTPDIKIKTRQSLESFLDKPIAGINLFLPLYREHANTPIDILHTRTSEHVIIRWLQSQTSMAFADPSKFLFEIYEGYNIKDIRERCNEALEKFSTVGYTQSLIKILHNYIEVLQYIILRENNETGEHKTDSDTREQYSKNMKSSASGDLTHNTLRIATCYLDAGLKEDCLKEIRKVTCLDVNLFKQSFKERLRQTIHCDVEKLITKQYSPNAIALYNNIIYGIDRKHQDPYKTTIEFGKLKVEDQKLIGYDSLNLAWNQCYFDVTFMHAEIPVLPKPASLELCTDNSQKHVSFQPLLYGLLLEYLWHEKYGSSDREKKLVLEKMEDCVLMDSMIPDTQKSVGLNFMAYCYSLQREYQLSSGCLVRSLRLNPVQTNLAYWYMFYRKYRIKRIRELSLDSQS